MMNQRTPNSTLQLGMDMVLFVVSWNQTEPDAQCGAAARFVSRENSQIQTSTVKLLSQIQTSTVKLLSQIQTSTVKLLSQIQTSTVKLLSQIFGASHKTNWEF